MFQNTVLSAQKVQFCATIELEKLIQDEDGMKVFVRSNIQPVYKEGLKEDEYLDMVEKMLFILYTFAASGSGWILVKIVQLEIRVALFAPMTGSSYIALPNKLQSSNSLLNIRNHEDHNCLLYCSSAAWHRKYGPAVTPPGQHPRVKRTDPRIYSDVNPVAHQPRGEFEMPMGLGQIPRFEEINKCRINIFQWVKFYSLKNPKTSRNFRTGRSDTKKLFWQLNLRFIEHTDNFFNVDRFEDKSLVPARVPNRKGDLLDVDLLLLEDGMTHHYVLITNLKNLICTVKKRLVNFTEQLCRNCFHICASTDVYERHMRSCLHNEPAIINLPSAKKQGEIQQL